MPARAPATIEKKPAAPRQTGLQLRAGHDRTDAMWPGRNVAPAPRFDRGACDTGQACHAFLRTATCGRAVRPGSDHDDPRERY